MGRLFIRFYLGVLLILLIGGTLQFYVLIESQKSENLAVGKQIVFGSLNLAQAALAKAEQESEAALSRRVKELASELGYPIEIKRLDDPSINRFAKSQLTTAANGNPFFYDREHACGPLGTDRIVVFGPMPSFVNPSQLAILAALISLLVLTALAIALLLRPVVKELRSIERAATSITAGELAARIPSEVSRSEIAVAFNEMAEKTEATLRTQNELLQAVSHELRTPLSRIRFAAELIEAADDDEQRAKRLASVDRAIDDLDQVVGELLSYIRLDSRTTSLEKQQLTVHEILEAALETHAPLFPVVEFQLNSRRGMHVRANEVSFRRAIGNLLSNAGRHAKSKVVLSTRIRDEQLLVRIEDDGCGVPPAERERIFGAFVRLENAVGKGSGLGLALVRRIAERHGGSVSLTDSPLGGACFEFQIPIGVNDRDDQSRAIEQRQNPLGGQL